LHNLAGRDLEKRRSTAALQNAERVVCARNNGHALGCGAAAPLFIVRSSWNGSR